MTVGTARLPSHRTACTSLFDLMTIRPLVWAARVI
jgi:hypothetical protein